MIETASNDKRYTKERYTKFGIYCISYIFCTNFTVTVK